MRESGRIVAETLALLAEHVRPGITTADLDKIAHDHIRARGAVPSFKGYNGFPASICTWRSKVRRHMEMARWMMGDSS